MALGSKSLHCVLLLLHMIMMIVALTVLVISALSLAELLGERPFLEGRIEESKSSAVDAANGEAEVLRPPARVMGGSDEGSPRGTITGPAILVVAVSAATVLLSAFAFYATLKRNVHLLSAFVGLMSVALAVQVSSGVWALAVRSNGVASIRATLIHQMDAYEVGAATPRAPRDRSPATSLWTHPWDAMQWQMKCCGVEGPDDYFGRGAIPLSCCAPPAPSDVDWEAVPSVTSPPGFSCHTIRRSGCLGALDDFMRTKQLWVGIFAIAGTAVEVIPMMLTVMYSLSIKRDLRRIYQ
ncbi:tetraspanin-12-like [Ischnura elegans]|uniref:tetraspanin-12-like n=1 Tax=Ischnura elegans TaxID=197161 RepID=UPI001ED8991C|nr:tetraspanin-12-like [Ischnura elegans]